MKNLRLSVFQLIERCSTRLPDDVLDALEKYANLEKGEIASHCLKSMLENNKLSRDKVMPLCQDTGNLIFKVVCPNKSDYLEIEKSIHEAVDEATEKSLLRKNSVNPITGENVGGNTAEGMPQIKFEISRDEKFEIYLIMKGGGCENVSRQYSLMKNKSVNDTRLEAIEKAILDAVNKAQGYGCSPGVLGVCIGGDRETGYRHAKEQLLRKLDDKNPTDILADMEKSILQKANQLKIGPMGMGGDTTLLGVKIGCLNRIPASFFVTISYMCWAYRRQAVLLNEDLSINKFLY